MPWYECNYCNHKFVEEKRARFCPVCDRGKNFKVHPDARIWICELCFDIRIGEKSANTHWCQDLKIYRELWKKGYVKGEIGKAKQELKEWRKQYENGKD